MRDFIFVEPPLDKRPDLSQEQGPRPGVSAYMEVKMREIPLTQGKVALVDDEDYEWLNQWKWYVMWDGHHWYAVRNSPYRNGKRHTIRMHRLIVGAQPGQVVDHKDSEVTLDNQRENLRFCTRSQNAMNAKKRCDGLSSRFKGVRWYKRDNNWMVRIGIDGKRIFLGYFDNEIEAAIAYNKAARERFGEFARLNVVNTK